MTFFSLSFFLPRSFLWNLSRLTFDSLLITVVAATSACGYCSRFLFHVRWRHQTPFVRQNTPHPRELKAKAHKLFSKGQNSLEDSDLHSESVVEAVNPTVQRPQTPPPPPPTLAIPEVTEQVIGNGAEDNSEPSAEEETIDVSCSLKAPDRASQVFRWTLRRSVAGGSPDCRFFRVLPCTRSKTVNGGCAGIGT